MLLGKFGPTKVWFGAKFISLKGMLLVKLVPKGMLLSKTCPVKGVLLGKLHPTKHILLGKIRPTKGKFCG